MTTGRNTENTDNLPALLLQWYDGHRRVMPWRALPGQVADPYKVWLSEIMLQQTTVAAVGPFFTKFLGLWPSVHELAAAELDDVLHAWAGLGYYARARNLHKCARVVAAEHNGRFPDTEDALVQLPGIGPYTAAAIAAIAFDRRATVVDGNVERVISRLQAVETPMPKAKPGLRIHAEALTPEDRCGDYAQAVMDLGATICSPTKPACGICPWKDFCAARRLGIAEELPKKAPKKVKPTRHGVAFWLVAEDGSVLLRRRPESGLLGGMMEVPSTEWVEGGWDQKEALSHAPAVADWQPVKGLVRHTFTHFHLELSLVAGRVDAKPNLGGTWCPPDGFGDYALPTAMKKVVRLALGKNKT